MRSAMRSPFGLSACGAAATLMCPLAAAAAPPDVPATPAAIVVSQYASHLHVVPPLGLAALSQWSSQREICTAFQVSARATAVPDVAVTSTGLGAAQFSIADTPSTRASVLRLGTVDANGHRLLMCLEADLVPNPGDTIQGNILVLGGTDTPVAVPINLDRPVTDPPSAAFAWFLALVVPAFITLGAAWITARIAERRKQKARFERFIDLAYGDLQDFFGTHFQTLYAEPVDDRSFAQKVEHALREQRIWTRIPDRERRRLLQCLRTGRRDTIRRDLQAIFSDWKSKLEDPREAGAGV